MPIVPGGDVSPLGELTGHPPTSPPPVTGDMRAVGSSQVACGPCYDKEQFPSHPWVTARDHCNLLVISLTERGGQEG